MVGADVTDGEAEGQKFHEMMAGGVHLATGGTAQVGLPDVPGSRSPVALAVGHAAGGATIGVVVAASGWMAFSALTTPLITSCAA